MRERHEQRRRELSVQRGGAENGTKPQTSLQGNCAGNRLLEAAVLGAVGVSGSLISTEAVTLRAARPAPSSGPAPAAPSAHSGAAPPVLLPHTAPRRPPPGPHSRTLQRPQAAPAPLGHQRQRHVGGAGCARQAGRQWLRREGRAGRAAAWWGRQGWGEWVRVRAIKWRTK